MRRPDHQTRHTPAIALSSHIKCNFTSHKLQSLLAEQALFEPPNVVIIGRDMPQKKSPESPANHPKSFNKTPRQLSLPTSGKSSQSPKAGRSDFRSQRFEPDMGENAENANCPSPPQNPQGPCHMKNTMVILIHYGTGKKIRR